MTHEHELTLRSLVSAARASSVPLIGKCPTDSSEDTFCWKFQHHDPSAPFDFWLLLSFRGGPRGSMVGSLLVPRDDGGLMHCVKTPVFHETFESDYLKVVKSAASGFGPVSVAKLKVRVVHEETRRRVFGSRFLAGRYDADLRPLGGYEVVSEEAFPPLPRHPGPDSTVAEHGVDTAPWKRVDLVDTAPLGGLRFDVPDPDAPLAELEVDGGAVVDPVAPGDLLAGTRPPGLYVDLAVRDGLSLAIYSLAKRGEGSRILFVDFCTGLDRDRFRERILVEKSRSWFGTRRKIIVIRKEARESSIHCGVLYERPEGA